MDMILQIFLSCVLGYLLGSVPFALVIGKGIYKTDIRTAGSKNLGGGNAGRVLGSKAGLMVMTLDILKVTLAMFLASLLPGGEENLIGAGLAAAVGHCFPLFAYFKGGKAVATLYGFLFGLVVVGGYSLLTFLVPLITFLIVLYITKIIALSSIASAMAAALYVVITKGFGGVAAALMVFYCLIIWRHRANLIRIKNHEENKVKWL